jgi:D-serine deaminase-like pyridoxal phosphate-dependent protein
VNDEALARLRSDPIDWRYKGFPPSDGCVTPATLREREWNVLAGDLLLPAMVLKESALAHNLELMAGWCRENSVSLAPHGKTTMSPELFARQLAAGAWGMTAATTSQARVYRAFGVQRILLANELVEPAAVRWVAAELAAYTDFELYCLADSLEAVAAMEHALAGERRPPRPLQTLVELGLEEGRTGARTLEDARAVADAIVRSPVLVLAGVEGYEGIVHDDALVERFLDRLRTLLAELAGADAFAGCDEVVLSAGGSVYFDRVAELVASLPARPRVRVVLRSGCYLTHDSGMYDRFSPLGARSDGERLLAALEVWAAVLSRPERDRALLGMGKRDVPHDIELPVPVRLRDASGLRDDAGPMTVFDLNDQHAYLRLPAEDPLAVGDLVGCGISHPCTAFDKWRLIPVVGDDYTVLDAVHTFF